MIAFGMLAAMATVVTAAAPEATATKSAAPEATKTGASEAAKTAVQPATPQPPEPEAKLVSSQWQSLYVGGKKVGYTSTSLFTLGDGGRRLETKQFLRTSFKEDKFGYFKIITADVDANFRPRALACQVSTPGRQWEVAGKREDREFVMTRKAGGATATSRIPIEGDMTFLSWALEASLVGGARAGQVRQWMVIDESLGAVSPDLCQVRVVGPAGGTGGQGLPPGSSVVLWAHGAERIVHVIDPGGRTVRSVWQTTPMVAEAAGLTDARRLAGAGAGPSGVEIEGLETGLYKDARLGINVALPAYPYVTYVIADVGAILISNLVEEESIFIRPASAPRAPVEGPLTDAEAARQADLLQREWAARFEDVKAGAATVGKPGRPGDGAARSRLTEGTARLGCASLGFRNLYLPGDGLSWLVSMAAADQPLAATAARFNAVADSIRLTAPEGRLPVQVAGDVLRSPAYGFELRRPGKNWVVPMHLDGPMTVIEMAREDGAAVAIVRVARPRAGPTVEADAAQQADAAAEKLGVARPEPIATTLGGAKAVQIAYEGADILSGDRARCTTIFTQLDTRILSLVLVVRSDADPTAARDAESLRESVRLEKAAAATH
jgi:hypothetical protein